MTTWNFTISQDLKRKDINIVEDTVSNAYETVLYLNRTRGHEDHESEPDKEIAGMDSFPTFASQSFV